jgi:hypothetical protein
MVLDFVAAMEVCTLAEAARKVEHVTAVVPLARKSHWLRKK